jgi:UDP-2-acetamido-3-amino-2,3-dideoxy-glucuronate N-acetyltransferase
MGENLRVAVVGAGYWGRNLVRNFAEIGVLAAVCDTDRGVLAETAGRYPGVRSGVAYTDLLTDAGIAAIAIATPAATHASLVREALLADKDVYVEKPLALSETEAAELTRLAAERNRVLMVGHLLWYHPAVVGLKALIAEGALGRIQYIYSNRLNMGKLRREENVLWSFAPHDVSVILGLVGEMPERVQAQGGNYLHRRIADTTVSLLDFASGVRAHIFVSWLHPFKEQRLVVVGERQMAVFDDTSPWPEKLGLYPHAVGWDGAIPLAKKAEVNYVPLDHEEPLRAECQHFLACIRTRETPRTDGQEGLRVLRVLNACQRSLEGGRAVRLEDGDETFVHESAVIDPDVVIGRGTRIWHFSHVLGRSRIGECCTIGQNVAIGPDVTIGRGCKIQNNVSVYAGVTLGEEVFCGPSVVFTNVLNPRAHVSRKQEFQSTVVERGATIGANATIVCGRTLGRYCFVAAGAVVTRDVPAHALVMGSPARCVGWMCACGERLGEDLRCRACTLAYRKTSSGLEAKAKRSLRAVPNGHGTGEAG